MLPTHARNLVQAKALLSHGWVVLPMSSEKTPLVAWANYVSGAMPSEADLEEWASRGMLENIGILTGSTSRNLLVLDFDDLGQAQKFIEKFPSLSKTMQIQTRRGIHFYFYAEGFNPTQGTFAGGDILWNKPCMSVPSRGYKRLNQLPILNMTKQGYEAFLAVFGKSSEKIDFSEIHNPQPHLSLQQIESLFSQNKDDSRNQALFYALCMARDNNYTMYQVQTSLIFDTFVKSEAPLGHRIETSHQRAKEFMRTMRSVYKKAPRPLRDKPLVQSLSDDSRTRLLSSGLAGAARVLDALYQKGLSEAVLSRREIIESIGDIIARDVIDSALKATFEGKLIFTVHNSPPSPAPHPIANAEKHTNKNAFYGRKKTGQYYLVPSPDKIQRITGSIYRASTIIKYEQIDSIKDYRGTLLKAKVASRKKIYQARLATDLGVTTRTIRTYLQLENLESIPQETFISTVTFANVNYLFEAEYSKAYYLKAHDGTKAPANLGGALWLLRQRKAVMLLKQTAAIYAPKGAKAVYESKEFKADMLDLMEDFTGGKRGDNLGAIRDTLPNRLNPNHPRYDAAFAAKIAVKQIADSIYLESLKQPKLESPKILEDGQSWEEIKLKRALLREIREDAAALCLLMPKKLLSHENAARLLIQFGKDACFQTAVKTTMDYSFSKNGKRPIKNPVGLMIKRLKKGGAILADIPAKQNYEHVAMDTPQSLGVWERNES